MRKTVFSPIKLLAILLPEAVLPFTGMLYHFLLGGLFVCLANKFVR